MTRNTVLAPNLEVQPHPAASCGSQNWRRCSDAVDRLIARHGWQLLDREEFVRRADAHLCAGVAADPRRAAIYTYSHALHAACSGDEGAQRQNLGYTELFHYLYDSARHRYPDVCDDATQRALETVFTAFTRCRQPGAFLAFALQYLMDAAKALRRQQEHCLQSLAMPVGAGDDTLEDVLPDRPEADPAAQVVAEEQCQSVADAAAAFLRSHPRARQQVAALWLKHVEGLDEATISRRLGKPVKSMYVLRSRAIEKLRDDPSWCALARDCGMQACGIAPSAM